MDRQTEGCQTVTLRLLLDAASVINGKAPSAIMTFRGNRISPVMCCREKIIKTGKHGLADGKIHPSALVSHHADLSGWKTHTADSGMMAGSRL